METFANVVMWIGLAGIGVSAVLFAAVWASDLILDRWRRARPYSRAVFAAAVCLAALYGGSKSAISFPKTEERAYLTDNGSYVTNDFVHIDFTRQIVPDEAEIVIERRQVAQTNDTDWAEFARSTFAEFAVPTNLPCANATNWNWIVYADWTPAPSVRTNGVLEVKWGVSRNDAACRAAGLAVGIPVQTKILLDDKTLVIPQATVCYTARDYVQDGLVAMWDGIENAGWETHDAAATKWKDLVGGNDLTVFGSAFWTDAALDTEGGGAYYGARYPDARTIEACVEARNLGSSYEYRSIVCNGPLNGAEEAARHNLAMMFWNVGNGANPSLQAQFSTFYPIADFAKKGPRTFATAFSFAAFDGAVSTNTVAFSDSWSLNTGYLSVGSRCGSDTSGLFHCVRIYSRELTADEIARNYAVDRARFGSGLGQASE